MSEDLNRLAVPKRGQTAVSAAIRKRYHTEAWPTAIGSGAKAITVR